jgi:hypothetical protein
VKNVVQRRDALRRSGDGVEQFGGYLAVSFNVSCRQLRHEPAQLHELFHGAVEPGVEHFYRVFRSVRYYGFDFREDVLEEGGAAVCGVDGAEMAVTPFFVVGAVP